MGIASVSRIGGDDGFVARILERRILELVSARSPAEERPLLEHFNGGSPAVDAFYVGCIGGNVRHGLQVLHQVFGRFGFVLVQIVQNVIGEKSDECGQHNR